MTVYVVMRESGGWSGTEVYMDVAFVFRERAAAEAWIESRKDNAHDTDMLVSYEIHEAEMRP